MDYPWITGKPEVIGACGSACDSSAVEQPHRKLAPEFVFELGETRVFEVPLLLFERRHFYRSELS